MGQSGFRYLPVEEGLHQKSLPRSDEACFGARHILTFLGFLGCAALYAMRVNLSVAVVAMAKTESQTQIKNLKQNDACPLTSEEYEAKNQAAATGLQMNSEFDWDHETQGIILGSFFYGYFLTNFLGGYMAERIGGRLVFGMGIILTAILTVLSPLAARHSTSAFILIRILEGMTEGVTFPSLNVLLSHWIPADEMSRTMSRILGGCQFGTVITLAVSGWLCESSYGWPSVFYPFGTLGIIWGIFWFCFVYEGPDNHPFISSSERHYLSLRVGQHLRGKATSVPWRSISTSGPFLAIVFAHVGSNWGFYCFLTELPTYLTTIQNFDMKANGFVSALPYLFMWLFSLSYSMWVDRMLASSKVNLRRARRLSTSLCLFAPMVILVLVADVGCNSLIAVILICLGVALTGAAHSGFICGYQEIAPNYAGTLCGISNTFATIPGFLAPEITGMIINEQQTLSQWKIVFYLASAVYGITGCVYLRFMSVEVQPWNYSRVADVSLHSKKNNRS